PTITRAAMATASAAVRWDTAPQKQRRSPICLRSLRTETADDRPAAPKPARPIRVLAGAVLALSGLPGQLRDGEPAHPPARGDGRHPRRRRRPRSKVRGRARKARITVG